MKLKVLVILTCLLFTSSIAQESYIDPRLRSYVAEFKQEAKKRFVNIDSFDIKVRGMYLEDRMKFPTMGFYSPEHQIILIAPYTFIDTLAVRATVYHEIGHAFIGSGHPCDVCGGSIMAAKGPKTNAIYANKERWNEYLDEFFELFPK